MKQEEDFKKWLDQGFSAAPGAPRNERANLLGKIKLLTARQKRDERLSLAFCLVSIALTIFIVYTTSKGSLHAVTNYHKESDVSESEELERDYDISLETYRKILHSSRSM